MDPTDIRAQFPALNPSRGKPLIYLNSACLTLCAAPVLEAMQRYYEEFISCPGRSTEDIVDVLASRQYAECRARVQRFIHASSPDEIIFVRNTTEAINLVARGFPFKPGDIVVTSDLEHNSNLVPWQTLHGQGVVKHRVLPTLPDTTFDLDGFRDLIRGRQVRLVSVLHRSNLSGVAFPVADVCEIAHEAGARVMLDAAQSAAHDELDVGRLGVDFAAFSFHKMFGPTGVGALYVKQELLDELAPLLLGGGSTFDTTYAVATLADPPSKFEAGLQDYAGIVGAAAAVEFIDRVGKGAIREHALQLNTLATERVVGLPGVALLGPADPAQRGSIVDFVVKGIRGLDLTRVLYDNCRVVMRYGRHCVHAWYNSRNLPESIRASFGPYNTEEEVRLFVDALRDVLKHFR